MIVHVLALSSAVLSAAATIFIRQGLRTGGSYAGFWLNIAVGAAGLWMAVLLTVASGADYFYRFFRKADYRAIVPRGERWS